MFTPNYPQNKYFNCLRFDDLSSFVCTLKTFSSAFVKVPSTTMAARVKSDIQQLIP